MWSISMQMPCRWITVGGLLTPAGSNTRAQQGVSMSAEGESKRSQYSTPISLPIIRLSSMRGRVSGIR